MNKPNSAKPTRRTVLKTMAAAFPAIIPGSALGLNGAAAPSNRVAMGFIGTGGKGLDGMSKFLSRPETQAVAVCDVLDAARRAGRGKAGLGEDDAYVDMRDLIARDDIDAVLIATPDHWHVPASAMALRGGKDVYCEKPLSNTIAEGRYLVDSVETHGAVFQHGTQLRSLPGVRKACELVRNGYIGEIERVVIGSPPGMAVGPQPVMPVPEGLAYDIWLGPAPTAPYTPLRVGRDRMASAGLPGWYFISDYSKSGWIAGYGVHDLDIAHWALGLEETGPVHIEGRGDFPKGGLFDTVTTYEIMFTYAGGQTIEMTDTTKNRHGVLFVGSEGSVFTRYDIETDPPGLKDITLKPEDARLYESGHHEGNFLDCVRTRSRTITPAEVAHRSTSVAHLGAIAVKLGRPLDWNPEKERFKGDEEANGLLACAMRPPYTL